MAIRLHEAYTGAESILACVCAALDEAQAQDPTMPGCPCRAFVAPGQAPAWDCSDGTCDSECAGQLTVNLVDLTESTQFPSTGGSRSAPKLPPGCVPPSYVVAEYVITLLRCVPVGYEDGSPPTPADMAAASRITLADTAVVYDALQCCLQGLVSSVGRPLKYQLGRLRTLAVEGGCTGLEARVTLYFPSCPCPEDGVIPDEVTP
jgi:hypothetical protein